MLVQSGNNRNHYQAEVNNSSSALHSSNFASFQQSLSTSASPPPPTSPELRKNVSVVGHNQSNSNVTSPHATSPAGAPGAIDNFNNNNGDNSPSNNGNNNRIHLRLSDYSAPQADTTNDNESSSVFLSEVDLVASVNISLLKKGNSKNPQPELSTSGGAGRPVVYKSSSTVATPTGGSGPSFSAAVRGASALTSGLRSSHCELVQGLDYYTSATTPAAVSTADKMSDAYLSGVKPESLKNNNNNLRQGPLSAPNTPETMRKHAMMIRRDLPIISHSMYVPHVSAKKEKMEFNQMMMKMNERDRPLSYHGRSSESNSSPNILSGPVNKRHVGGGSSAAARTRKEAAMLNRRSMPSPYLENRFREKFDVSALDTNLPRIDLEAIENHLRLAREEERKIMFNSVLSTLKSQTEKLKESINSEQIQNLSSRLKNNVVEKSSMVKDSLTQTFQPYLISGKTREGIGVVETATGFSQNGLDDSSPPPHLRRGNAISYGHSDSDSAGGVGKVSFVPDYPELGSKGSKRGNQSIRDDRYRYRRQNGNGSSNGLGPTLKWPMLQNGNRTWISFDTGLKSRYGGGRWQQGSRRQDEGESSESSDEDDDNITGRFERVISLRSSKRRSDREEIRRRLALESEDVSEKPSGRKPSLHSRLQSTSDSESPNSDTEAKHQQQPASLPHVKAQPVNGNDGSGGLPGGAPSEDFYARQARLQAEARQALSQAKDNARLQMAQERERRLTSPITDMVKNSLLKVGVILPPERRRVSRQLLTEMNVAQLQVIVNDLHTHIEVLNETLVSMLLERDDLHMEQDSMLVDIEDLTRYLAAKDNSPHQSLPLIAPSRNLLGKK